MTSQALLQSDCTRLQRRTQPICHLPSHAALLTGSSQSYTILDSRRFAMSIRRSETKVLWRIVRPIGKQLLLHSRHETCDTLLELGHDTSLATTSTSGACAASTSSQRRSENLLIACFHLPTSVQRRMPPGCGSRRRASQHTPPILRWSVSACPLPCLVFLFREPLPSQCRRQNLLVRSADRLLLVSGVLFGVSRSRTQTSSLSLFLSLSVCLSVSLSLSLVHIRTHARTNCAPAPFPSSQSDKRALSLHI